MRHGNSHVKNIILGYDLSSPFWAGGSAVSYVSVVNSSALHLPTHLVGQLLIATKL